MRASLTCICIPVWRWPEDLSERRKNMETRDSEIKIPGKEDIPSPDRAAMEKCQSRWLSIAKPLFGLGTLEDAVTQMAGMTGTADVSIDKKGLIVMCADNGVVEEGISQTDSSVTAVVTDNFSRGLTSACIMSRAAGVDVFPIDIGVAADTKVYTDKIAYGTKNMLKEPAMTREEAEGSILAGIRAAKRLKKEGYQILLTGEMGIGNTTTSSAVASVLLGEDPERLSGRGAGLSDAGLQRKREVIRRAIGLWKPDPADPIDVLAKVGGFDIGGLAGVFLGGAMERLPVVMDGFISAAAALLACRIAPGTERFILPSHMSGEPGMGRILKELGKEAFIGCHMKLGEGTGAVALMPLLDMTLEVYRKMPDFAGIQIEAYKPLGGEA